MTQPEPFELSEVAPPATVTIPLYHPVTGAELPIAAVCAGYYTAAERAASHALADAEEAAAGAAPNAAAAAARYRAYVAAVLVAMPGATLDGQPVECPRDTARLLDTLPFLAEQIFMAYVKDLAFFGKRRPSS